MKKENLKFGNVVELRNGERYLYFKSFNYNLPFYLLKTSGICTYLPYDNFNNDLKSKNNLSEFDIVKVYEDYTCSKLLWERKKELLTPEEKEWLSAVIKPFRDKVVDISLQSGSSDYKNFISIYVNGDAISLPYIQNLPFKFKCLEKDKEYTLEELGL